ncbi:hypothetical protein NC653_034030 [Populus alba x Populus x berolinensis]|uniref:Uncharacterized protein n=1 Tax=Populus alba x Populus x berolinensis TaxID=444605 RepID=A0AAD6PZZ7_9ROSI|nr:hypothetical protein NC653_034030 [Populus alba x Populus x berolinensis]
MQLLSFQLLQPQWTDCLLFFFQQDLKPLPYLPQRIRIPHCLPSKPLFTQVSLQHSLSLPPLSQHHRWVL